MLWYNLESCIWRSYST